MHIKRYILASAILLGIVGWYVYSHITQDKMGLEIYGVVIPELPIALLVVVPAIALLLFSIFHMSFYSFLNGFKLRKYEKDAKELIDAFGDAYLQKIERDHSFKTERYKVFGELINNSQLIPNKNISKNTSNEKINVILRLLNDIESGVSVDLRAYGLKAINPIVMKNNRNKFNNGDLTAEEILKDASNYDEELCKLAYIEYAKTYSVNGILQFKSLMTKDALMAVLNRVNNGEHSIEIDNKTLMELFESIELTSKDYIEISMTLSKGMDPEKRIKLFETLSEKNEIAMEAYLYTLFDLEMLSVAEDILENSQPDEFLKFKAYAALKDSHHNFNISLFL